MQKLLILFIILGMTESTFSQNIGIGTGTPTAKLQINHRNTSGSPALTLLDSTAGTGSKLLFSKQGLTNNFSLLSTIDLFAANCSLDIRTTFNSGIFLRGDGRVGINNVTSPTATLHVGGGVKINDTLNVTGDMNITGKLKVNNDAGTAGQVLVSQGTGNSPEWAASSFPADERAWITTNTITINAAPFRDTIDLSNVDYNTSTATFNFTNNTITINKAGLYRFQGMVFVDIQNPVTLTGPFARCVIKLRDDALSFIVSDEPVYDDGNFNNRGIPFSADRYITAGSVICLTFSMINLFSTPALSIFASEGTYFSFYLISE